MTTDSNFQSPSLGRGGEGSPFFVIADDITGAAEIAGLGSTYGLSTILLTKLPDAMPDAQLVVLATDTRSMTEAEAVAETRAIGQWLCGIISSADAPITLYKKVDAAVRGHVVAELQTLMETLGYEQSLYLPANPSKGRTISGGCCYVDGEPIDQTQFALDPDFPAFTASICLRLGITPSSRIRVADAVTLDDVRQAIGQALQNPEPTLLSGASDLFAALLENMGFVPSANATTFAGLSRTGAALIVCGSTQSTDLTTRPYIRQRDLPLNSMPRDVFDGTQGAAYWLMKIQILHFSKSAIRPARHGLILNIPFESSGSSAAALRLRTEMAQVVFALVGRMQPAELVIEGGATAFAVMQRLGWTSFRITQQVAPGVVRMQSLDAPETYVTFKPGSYHWGDDLFDWKVEL